MSRVGWHEARRRCESLVATLRLPEPFELANFCAVVAAGRGRPLVLRPVGGIGHQITGLWLALSAPPLDVIVYERRTTRLHREHIVLHELAHMLTGHRPTALVGAEMAMLFPDLRPDAVRRMLARRSYTSVEEWEAELVASLILLRAKRPVKPPGSAAGSAIERLEAFHRG